MRHGEPRKEKIDLMFSSDIPIIVVILAALFLALSLFYSLRLRSFEARLQALVAKIEDMNGDTSRQSTFASKLTEERLVQTEQALAQLRSIRRAPACRRKSLNPSPSCIQDARTLNPVSR
ncbi:MAG: hypothetical protein EBY21_07775 [Alphaproteobacteria bacterium]|nr:hypothetical protein [Alphaproteobacteria bacterium]